MRTALVFASIAAVFFAGILAAKFMGEPTTGIGVIGGRGPAVPGVRHRPEPAQVNDEHARDGAGRQLPERGATDAGIDQKRSNLALVRRLGIVVVGMFAFGYALVPFYDQICRVTGLRNIAQPDVVANTQVDTARSVRIEFDTNLRGLPWTFRSLEPVVDVHPGELRQVVFEVRNNTDRPVTGQAIPSYGPQHAAPYFRKLDCFCFAKQTLQPGEVRQMPVVFAIGQDVPADLTGDHAVLHVLRSRRRGRQHWKCGWAAGSRASASTGQDQQGAIHERSRQWRQAVLLHPATVALADHRRGRAAADGDGRGVLVQRIRRRDRGRSRPASRSWSTCCSAGSDR